MKVIKLTLSHYGNYAYSGPANTNLLALADFLSTDLSCTRKSYPTYQDWAMDDSLGIAVSGNLIHLKKEGDFVVLSNLYPEEEKPTELTLLRRQFIALVDAWQSKVCPHKPKEVTIKYENGEFVIETSD